MRGVDQRNCAISDCTSSRPGNTLAQLWAAVVVASYQPGSPGQQLLHHSLFQCAGLGEPDFEGGGLGVHIGKDGGDGGLFFKGRQAYL